MSFVARINELQHQAQSRRGDPLEDMVRGWKANGIIRRLLATVAATTLPPKGRWASWQRMGNLNSFWVQYHPLKKLNFASSVFANPDEYEVYLPQLYEWEDAHPELEFRDLPSDPTSAEEQADDGRMNDSRVQKMSAMVFDTTGVTGYFPPVAAVEKLLAFADLEDIEMGLSIAVTKNEALGTRKTKVRDFFENDGAVSAILSLRAEAAQNEKVSADRAAKKAAEDAAEKAE